MKRLFKNILTLLLGIIVVSSCEDDLTELNQNPNGINPETANPNMLLPVVLGGAAQSYLSLGFGDVAGVMQHTQKDGWFSGHNSYDWNAQDWAGWYDLLRNNQLMFDRSVELDWKFHQGVALTMRGFIFGTITDFWGDAPYTNAMKAEEGGLVNEFPVYDSQEIIYNGIIQELQAAVNLFGQSDDTGISSSSDLYYGGNIDNWEQFANSLLIRYYMRISEKVPSAQSGLEAVVATGRYIQTASDDATLNYTGGGNDLWPSEYAGDNGSSFRRLKPCQTLVDQLRATNDPRMSVWFAPVHCQWVADPGLATEVDEFIRKDGVIQNGITSLMDIEYVDEIAAGHIFTRHYNPNTFTGNIDDNTIVGLPPALMQPSAYNLNPTPGQVLENQHVSQLAPLYRQGGDDQLNAILISAAELSFTLAEAALNGWNVGKSAKDHYEDGIRASLETWGLGDDFDTFIATEGIAFEGVLEQIMTQKWVSSWTAANESWFDYRRTGLPELVTGPASDQPVLPIRFNYGSDEINNNEDNYMEARARLTITPFSGPRENDSQWSKMWLLQGTGKPW